MMRNRLKCLLVLIFSVFILSYYNILSAQANGTEEEKAGANVNGKNTEKKGFDAQEVIFNHVLDAHEFHFMDLQGADGKEHPVTIPLPVIIYSPQRGFTSFSSAKFEHGEAVYEDYKLKDGEIKAVKADNATVDESVKVYDLSLTRNVVQMMLALAIFVWLMLSIAAKYKKGEGVKNAPKGSQSLMEPVITFIRDEVAKPNLGSKADKFLPYLLTVFFFILINNIFGLIPGSANVTGNIAFTAVLGVISFIVIMFTTNRHFWGHIFWPPDIPVAIKPIMIIVEILGIFTKPFALIIRLFANMLAGHIIIICLISLIFIFGGISAGVGWGFSPISIVFAAFIYLIEVLVAFIQAFIFTNLTAVFVGQSMEGGHEHEDGHDDAVYA